MGCNHRDLKNDKFDVSCLEGKPSDVGAMGIQSHGQLFVAWLRTHASGIIAGLVIGVVVTLGAMSHNAPNSTPASMSR